MKQIGRYVILGRLGRGGMSTVYKAQAPITGRTVALKILLPRDEMFADLVGADRLREIFLEEARVMGEINHDHVAKIIDCDEDLGAPFIVLEYFAHSIGALIGEAYRVERPSRVISINKTYAYIRQSLLGLERLHFAGIIHRDVKPYNLMITNDDRVKIIDFGLSKVRGEEKMAIPGMQVGSPYYAAPEQEKDPRSSDERADLFSIGVMAYRMVTGRLAGGKGADIAAPSTLNADLTPEWDDFLLRSISGRPEDRFSSAHEMRLRLEEVFQNWARASKTSWKFQAQDQAGPKISVTTPRTEPAFIRYKDLGRQFDLDELMRLKNCVPHRFELRDRHLLFCLDTGLLWQREGAGFTLTWEKAHQYVDYLNRKRWQGRDTWRLPTVEELRTLLRPPASLRDFAFESYFATDIHWLWSCDDCSKRTAWTIDVVESYFERLDKDGTASVCAVCSSGVRETDHGADRRRG
jgi:serine/threonine protein kinase